MKKISRRNFLHASALAGAALVGSLAAPAAFAEETPAAAGVQPIARDLGWKTVSDTVYSYSALGNVLLAHCSDVVIRSSPLTTSLQVARPSRRLWIWWRTSFK